MSIVAPALRRDSPSDAAEDGTLLGLLGGFDLRHGAEQIGLPLTAQRLVAFLALRHRAVQRIFVSGTLWAESSQDAANASLRTALWRLRRPSCELVCATATHVSVTPGIVVDVFEATAAASRVTRDAGASRDDLERLVVAEELLPDWYDDWVILDRERFRQTRMHALETLSETFSDAGRYGDAIEAGLSAVAGEPLRESAHRAVVRAHLAHGNRADALRQYTLFRRLLAAQLGLEPSSLMTALLEDSAVPVTNR
jgi:DNA-binding SARP family transcriptional activator